MKKEELSKGQKISIARKNVELRSIKSVKQAVEQLNAEGKKYTYKDIELITGLKERTIQKYAPEIIGNKISHTQNTIRKAVKELKKENKKITYANVAKHTGFCLGTIKSYKLKEE